MGLFTSDYSNHELVQVVREVTLHVNPRYPKRVSLRTFDPARTDAGHPHAPRASRICERLDMSWPELKKLAHSPEREIERTLVARLGAEDNTQFSLDDAVESVRAVAKRLGVETLDPAAYDREAGAIRRAAHTRWRHGRGVGIPTANQVAQLAGGFDAAAKLAGLRPYQPPPDPGASIVDALELLVDEYGCLLPYRELTHYAHRKGFSLKSAAAGDHQAAIAELRRRRERDGKETPSGYPPKSERPSFDDAVPSESSDLPPARKHRWSWEECIEALVRLMDENPGADITQRSYRTLRAGRRTYPNVTSFNAGGRPGLKVAREEAIRRRRARRRGGTSTP